MYGRFGGEEFVVVLSHADLRGAFGAIDHIREILAEKIFTFGGHDVVVTASFGIATLDETPEDFGRLVARADGALYSAKQSGRNRIALATRT
jgi:diguanylate cyclase (GGDEF)-like protein